MRLLPPSRPWHAFVSERERRLAAGMESIKVSGDAVVGSELLDPGARSDDLDGLLRFAGAKLDHAEEYFALPGDIAYRRSGNLITFESSGARDRHSPNGIAVARLFEARRRDRAVVMLPYWNSQRHELAAFGRMLAACGITCLQLSLPYHDERQTPGVGFARELVCENLGLTLAANRQAILDARACLAWLETAGYRRLGIVGLSVGASIASIVAALDARVAAAALLLMADDFADVVWTGSATRHVRQSLQRRFTPDDVRDAWALISPASYADRLARRIDDVLIVSGDLDAVFIPELTQRYVDRLRRARLDPDLGSPRVRPLHARSPAVRAAYVLAHARLSAGATMNKIREAETAACLGMPNTCARMIKFGSTTTPKKQS